MSGKTLVRTSYSRKDVAVPYPGLRRDHEAAALQGSGSKATLLPKKLRIMSGWASHLPSLLGQGRRRPRRLFGDHLSDDRHDPLLPRVLACPAMAWAAEPGSASLPWYHTGFF